MEAEFIPHVLSSRKRSDECRGAESYSNLETVVAKLTRMSSMMVDGIGLWLVAHAVNSHRMATDIDDV